MRIILLAFVPLVLCAPDTRCDIFNGFGSGFGGQACSADLNGGCVSVLRAQLHISDLINGNMSAIYLLIQDILNLYNHVMNSEITCQWSASISQFIQNIPNIPYILLKNYPRVISGIQCIENSFKTEDFYQMGSCIGDILKVLVTPY
eukprot:TRINITY_DN5996_c0_g1_i15.p1 TRINITY_DN5996_c0_g1~~TRINITY_DN5996_c0_g1_i15.p1  ORF type:complete len:147 (-),score=10.14 TRINITY_DN5996_c0_g1_i15:126-566(-)